MRILHFHFGRDGGAERFFVTLADAFAERGVEQMAMIRPDRPWRAAIEPHVTVMEGAYRRYLPSRFLVEARVRHTLRTFKPDVIMAWMTRASRLVPMCTDALRVARLGDYPTKLDYFRHVDVIVCNTPGIAEHVRALGWKRRVEVISNFTLARPVPPVDRASLETPKDAFVVAASGRFVQRKGFHTLIEAVARMPGAYLWLIGDGQERQALERLAAEKGIADRMRITGWQTDTAPFTAAADVTCMPSSHEPLGNVILEAWAVGRPVVSSRSEGPSWMMEDGRDGLLVDIGDAGGFAAALTRLREDPALAARLVEGGRRTLEAHFTRSAVTDAYLQLFAAGRPKIPA